MFALKGWVGGQTNMYCTTKKVQTRDVRGQKMPKNANIICESSLIETTLKKVNPYLEDVVIPCTFIYP